MRSRATLAAAVAAFSLTGCGRVGFALEALDAEAPRDAREDVPLDGADADRADAPNGDASDASDMRDARDTPEAPVMTTPCFDLSLGLYEGTRWDGSSIVLDGAAQGVFTTAVCDAGSVVAWASLVVSSDEPYGKGLSAGDLGYPGGDLDRTGLIASISLDGAGVPSSSLDVDGSAASITDGDATLRYVPAVFGQGMSFDGVDDLLTIADDGRFDFGGGDFTLSAWVRTTHDCGHWCGFMGRQVRADGGITLEMAASDQANFFLGYLTRESDNLTGGEPIGDDRFHHLVGVREGVTATLYVDGERAAHVDAIAYPRLFDSDAPLEIGGYTDGAAIMRAPAVIDEVSIWGRALREGEVAAMHRRGALRLSFRVRACDDVACEGEPFVGPDGTPETAFDESRNEAPGPPTYAIDATSRYFQVEARLEGDGESSPALHALTPLTP